MIKTRPMKGWLFSRCRIFFVVVAVVCFWQKQLVILLFKFWLEISFFSVKNHFSSEVYLTLKPTCVKFLGDHVSKL